MCTILLSNTFPTTLSQFKKTKTQIYTLSTISISILEHFYVKGLESEIRARDHGIMGTNAAVGKLEVHNVTSLQDLRGRIVRCDVSIHKHSTDIRTCFGDIQRVINDQYKAHTAVQEVIHQMEAQVRFYYNSLLGKYLK